MRSLASPVLTALAGRSLVARDLFWITVHDRNSPSAVQSLGLWNDVGTVSTSVIDALTGATVSRTFYGAGSLVNIPEIPLTADLSVREINVTLSQVDDIVANAIRGYDAKQAPVQIYRALFDPTTRLIVNAGFPRFVGFVDTLTIQTASEGGTGGIVLKLVSQIRELTRDNPDVRSSESQNVRASGDTFYKYVEEVGEWKQWWGRAKGKLYR